MTTTTITQAPSDEGSKAFVFEATHRLTYTTKNPVPIKEVIIALQGLEGLLKPIPAVVSAITGVEIDGAEFLIHSMETGSLIEDIIVKFFFKDQAGLDAFLAKLSAKKGMKTTVIAVALAGVAGYGLHMATSKPTPTITATNSVIIQNGAGALNIAPEALEAAIVAATQGDKKKIAESALKFTSPVRADPKSEIKIAGVENGKIEEAMANLSIPYAAVAEAPARIELGRNERFEKYVNTELFLRATDLDSKKRGWAGKLGTRPERLPIELDSTVDEGAMFGRSSVRVDADLIFREKGKGHEMAPSRIIVRKVYPAAP